MKNYVNYLSVSNYIADLERQILDIGISLEYRTDFGYFVRLCETLPDKAYPTAMFNPLHHDIGQKNGFWIKGTNEEGEVVHVQAVRYDDFTTTNLAHECENLTAFYLDPEVSAEDAEWCQSFAPVAKQITGPTCYHGEVWFRGGVGGYRAKGLSKLLPRLAMALALLKWNPNFIYGFVYDRLVSTGVMMQYGYSHTQKSVVYWHRPSRDKPLDVWVVWMTHQDLIDMISSDQERDNHAFVQVGHTRQDRRAVLKAAAE